MPSGRLIQRSYANKHYFEAYDDSLIGEGVSGDSPRYKTAGGRIVYGSGGISPDVLVSAKEAVFDEERRRLYLGEHRVFYTYMKDYLERHPEVKQDSG